MLRLSFLSSITDLDTIANLARKFLVLLGEGTSRSVYRLNDRYVIKIAKDKCGVWQNQSECRVTDGNIGSDLILPVDKRDANGLWVVQMMAQPIDSSNCFLFKKLYGVSFEQVCELICAMEKCEEEVAKYICGDNAFLTSIMDFLVDSQTSFFFDFKKLDSWGYIDNKICLIDYGMDNEAYDMYRGKHGRR
jgi:hypothetical protein